MPRLVSSLLLTLANEAPTRPSSDGAVKGKLLESIKGCDSCLIKSRDVRFAVALRPYLSIIIVGRDVNISGVIIIGFERIFLFFFFFYNRKERGDVVSDQMRDLNWVESFVETHCLLH